VLVINACQKHQYLGVFAAETVIQFFVAHQCLSKTLLSLSGIWNNEEVALVYLLLKL